MKKIFLFVAFAGMVGASAVSAGNLKQDDKNKTEHHDCSKHAKGECKKDHDCSKHPKGECHKDGKDSAKHCTSHPKGKKDCCKHGATPATPAK